MKKNFSMKVVSLILAVLMLFALGIPAAAEGDETTGGEPATTGNSSESKNRGQISIIVDKDDQDQTFKAYKLFDVTYTGAADNEHLDNEGKYSYTIKNTDPWFNIINTYVDTNKGMLTLTQSTIDTSLYLVTWNSEAENSNEWIQNFAIYLNQHKDDEGIKGVEMSKDTSYTTDNNNKVKYTAENLPLGYYFVSSALGAFVGLDTTNPKAEITDKATLPYVDKYVYSDNPSWEKISDAGFTDTVKFRTEITVDEKPEDDADWKPIYTLYDFLPNGFTLVDKDDSFKVYKQEIKEGGGYKVEEPLTVGTDYTVKKEVADGEPAFSFKVTLEDDTVKALKKYDRIIVEYSATVGDTAVVEKTGNINRTYLTYLKNNKTQKTAESSTTTYVLDLDILKIDGATNAVLPNAELRLYRIVEDKTKEYAAVTAPTEEETDYKLNSWQSNLEAVDEDGENYNFTMTSNEAGEILLKGLDKGFYYLEEIKAPDGYNLLTTPVQVDIIYTKPENGIVTSRYRVDEAEDDQGNFKYDNQVTIANNSGTMLPTTGGIGTTIFYVVGGVLLLGSFILLVTRKRMKHLEN